jgi:hypothetical protein
VLKAGYGYGKALFFAFDLGMSITESNLEQMKEILGASVGYVHLGDEQTLLYPYMIRPVKITALSPVGLDIVLNESYTPGVTLIDSVTGLVIPENPTEFPLHLNAGEPEEIVYYVLMPDAKGTYRLVTEAGNTNAAIEFTLEGNSTEIADGIIAGLNNLSVKGGERQMVNNARKLVSDARDGNVFTTADMEGSIGGILDAVENISGINDAMVDSLRLDMDRLLGIWQERWYISDTAK